MKKGNRTRKYFICRKHTGVKNKAGEDGVEDTPHGVSAAKAAGCCCVAVPSLRREKFDMYKGADRVYHSLLDVELEDFGLPKFEDWRDVETVEFIADEGDERISTTTRKYERFLKLERFLEHRSSHSWFWTRSKMLSIHRRRT